MKNSDMKFRAVIFDFDGTLVDSLQDIADAMNTALSALGLDVIALDDYRYNIGYGVENLARRLVPKEKATEEVLAECVRLMRLEYAQCWNRTTKPYPGIMELLDALRERCVKTAVLSNKDHDFIRRMTDYFFKGHDFDSVQGALPSFPKKPDPSLALRVAGVLAEKNEHIILAGDTRTDMETAVAADMYPLGCLWGYRDEEELRSFGARMIISSPGELMRLFTD